MPLPMTYPLAVYQGHDRVIPVKWKADGVVVTLTGYGATFGVWTPGQTLIDTATAGDGPSDVLGIELQVGTDAVTVTLPDTLAAALATRGKTLYDLIVTAPDGTDTALLHGPFMVELGRPA